MQVNVHNAKTNLSKLIEHALRGEDVVIARAGKPAVRLVRVRPKGRVFGSAAGTIHFTAGWDAPMSEAAVEAMLSH